MSEGAKTARVNVQRDKAFDFTIHPSDKIRRVRVITKKLNGRLVTEYELAEGCELTQEKRGKQA